MALIGNGELAVTEGVPELNSSIAGSRDDLSVIGGEGNRENIVGVTHESASSRAGGELPEAESLVPGSRQCICTIR